MDDDAANNEAPHYMTLQCKTVLLKMNHDDANVHTLISLFSARTSRSPIMTQCQSRRTLGPGIFHLNILSLPKIVIIWGCSKVVICKAKCVITLVTFRSNIFFWASLTVECNVKHFSMSHQATAAASVINEPRKVSKVNKCKIQ